MKHATLFSHPVKNTKSLFLFITLSAAMLITVDGFAKQAKLDSLLSAVQVQKEDSAKVISLNRISKLYSKNSNYSNALKFGIEALNLAKKLSYKKGIADSETAIGVIYRHQGNYPEALTMEFEAMKLYEELAGRSDIASSYNHIGLIYENQGNTKDALKNYFSALKIYQELKDKGYVAIEYNNIGNVFESEHNYPEALKNYSASLAIENEIGDTVGIAFSYNNLGVVYFDKSDYPEALKSYLSALKLFESSKSREYIAGTYLNLGQILARLHKMPEGMKYLKDGMAMAKELGLKDFIKQAYSNLAEADSIAGNFKQAFLDYKMYTVYRDSLNNEENTKKTVQTQMQYEFDKKEAVTKAENEKQTAISIAEKKKQRVILYSVIGGLVVVLFFAGFVVRSLRVTRRQKHIIELQKGEVEHQKEIVEVHQKEIIDSITYAKRLQEAILPPLDFVKKYLPESFILYKPKDIVAGDFYWMEIAGDTLFIAAADCTGHGVPGAMVSVVCCNALNRTVKEFGLRDTGEILSKVTELVLETFEKSEKDVKDGMDISLMSIHTVTKQIQWSGANNALWYIQNNAVIEIPANKQPIGKHDNRKPFTAHNINYQPGTTFYLYTDGYADQFGGAKGKKFKYNQLEEKLLEISSKSLSAQHELLDKIFVEWRGGLEQVDDVCIIGIRI